MAGYKKEQGRLARTAVFWTLAALLYYGCASLRQELAARVGALGRPLVEDFPRIPVLGVALTGAFVIAAVVFAAGVVLLYRWLERPKHADLLIETEQELRKVTWPTVQEAVNSSLVVILFVLFLMAYLAGADALLANLTRTLLFGGAGR